MGTKPAVTRIVSGRVVVAGMASRLQLVFRAREVVVVGANPFCHLNDKWEGGGAGQETPPTRVTSKGEGGRVQSVCECSGGKEGTTRRG